MDGMMPMLRIQLRRRELVAEQTMAFYFEKPQGFQFKPGQTLDLTLIEPQETDAEGNTRTFSIASTPQDADLCVATRMRSSAFKRVLASAPLGTSVEADGPMGSFTLHHNATKPAVFLAGGIGITPFRSIIRHAAAERTGRQLWLFYSNTRPESAAFLNELRSVAGATPSFHFVPTMTKMTESTQAWNGETSLIDGEMLTRHLSALAGPVYYIAGPPPMVTAMRDMLGAAGIDEDDIRSEEFAGY
jgi:ferredoxin-NADP reductase